MAKKKIVPDNQTVTDINELTRKDIDNVQIKLAEIDTKYGDLEPYNRGRIEQEAKFYLNQSAQSMLEAGKRFVLLKEHEDHGNFLTSLEKIGIAKRAAQKMMQVAVKFLDDAGLPKAPTLALLPASKLYELALMDDDDIEALTEAGTVAGLSLEDADKMTTRELRAEIRKLKKEKKDAEEKILSDRDIQDQLLQDKNKKIDELDREIRTLSDPAKWQEKAEHHLQRLLTMIPTYSQIVSEYAEIISDLDKMEVKDWEQSQIVLMEQAKFNIDMMISDTERLKEQIRFLAPEGNAVYHQMNDLRLISAEGING